MRNFNLIKVKMADLRPLPIDTFSRNAIHSTFFYISLKNSYHISISLIAHMSLKLGKICTESRSWRPKIIGHYFCNTCMRNMWKTRPDS